METFDRIAGWAEILLVPTSLGLLLVACGLGGVRIWRWRLLWALAVVWVVGVVGDGLGAVLVGLLFLGAVTLVARSWGRLWLGRGLLGARRSRCGRLCCAGGASDPRKASSLRRGRRWLHTERGSSAHPRVGSRWQTDPR